MHSGQGPPQKKQNLKSSTKIGSVQLVLQPDTDQEGEMHCYCTIVRSYLPAFRLKEIFIRHLNHPYNYS